MTFAYRFGGLDFSSNIALNGLREACSRVVAGGHTVVDVRAGRAAVPDKVLFSWGGRYGLRLGICDSGWVMASQFDGTFLIAPDGRRIDVSCSTLPPLPEVMDVLSRRVMPRVANLSERVAVHAAAVCKGDGCLLLLGRSGAGKSTTVASLAQDAGWQILSDDISILRDTDRPVVEPGTTGVCLWPQSQAALRLDPNACYAMPGYDGKLRFEPDLEHRLLPAPLKALVVLERSTDCAQPELECLRRAETLIAAIRQLVLFNPTGVACPERALQVGRLNAMLRTVPGFVLRYPADFGMLPKTAGLLEALVVA